MASTISNFHSINRKFARASSLQWTAHLILILVSVSSQGWQTPRGVANKVSISTNDVSSSFCLSFNSFVLSSCLARSSSHSGTSWGVDGLSVFIMAVSTALTFVGGLCFLPVTGVACSRRGTLAGHALIMLEDAGYAWGEVLVMLGGMLVSCYTHLACFSGTGVPRGPLSFFFFFFFFLVEEKLVTWLESLKITTVLFMALISTPWLPR